MCFFRFLICATADIAFVFEFHAASQVRVFEMLEMQKCMQKKDATAAMANSLGMIIIGQKQGFIRNDGQSHGIDTGSQRLHTSQTRTRIPKAHASRSPVTLPFNALKFFYFFLWVQICANLIENSSSFVP